MKLKHSGMRVVAAVLLAGSVTLARADWPGEAVPAGEHARRTFEVDGRAAWVIVPQHPAPGHPWVWRARFPGFHTEADAILLDRGFHVAYMNTDGMLGSPAAMEHWDAFYAFAIEHGLARRVALEAVSRGGLFAYGFASRWPERVACIYADTPVCDFKSWPAGQGKGRGDKGTWQRLLKEYGFTEAEARAYRGNPIDSLAPIAKARIPILHIVSLTDVIVPPTENTFILAKRYRELGGEIDIIEVAEGTEQSGGHHFTHPDPVRVADFIERQAAVLPGSGDYFELRGTLDNCRVRFEREKTGIVAFLGGSITYGSGWRDLTAAYLQQRFPETEFTFINAGIPSTGSVPGAFRLEHDVLSRGPIDLLFEEAAVNDLHNMRSDIQMTRGMEGVLRRARTANPNMDIVVLHFVDPHHMDDYRAGRTPNTIAHHEPVAVHYGVPTVHLAREVTERIDAGQFSWADDFKDLHPSPYGHRLYAGTLRRFLSSAWAAPLAAEETLRPHAIPGGRRDEHSYDRGKLVSPDAVREMAGFEWVEKCDPRAGGVGGGVRAGFVDVPMLVGDAPGDSFTWRVSGRAFGLFVAAGPDAGVIEYRVDDGEWRSRDLFTKWSGGLHLPWAYVLADELGGDPSGKGREITVRVGGEKNPRSKGHACRVVWLLVNE